MLRLYFALWRRDRANQTIHQTGKYAKAEARAARWSQVAATLTARLVHHPLTNAERKAS